MKTSILQLDPHEDAISIRDKISWSKSERIILIFPKKYRFSLSLLDLTLIKRESESLGSQVAIISRDRWMHEHANSLAIPVFSSVPQAEKGNWNKQRERPLAEKRNQEGYSAIIDKQAALPGYGIHKSQPTWIRIVTMVLAVSAFAGLVIFLIPSATVKVYPATQKQQLNMDIIVSDTIKTSNISGIVPATKVPMIVSDKMSANSTGTVEILLKKAKGKVTVTNQGTQVTELPEGLIISTNGETTQEFVSLSKPGVVLQPGSSTVIEVEAINPGRQGNIQEGINLSSENLLIGNLTFTTATPFAGGESVMVPSPSDNDYKKLKDLMMTELEAEAKELLSAGNETEYLVGEIKLEKILSENRLNPVGEPSDTLTLSISAQYQSINVKKSELTTLFSLILDLSIDNSYHAVNDDVEIKQTGEPEINGAAEMKLHLTGSRLIARDWDRNEISNLITGKRAEVAKKILDDQIGHSRPAEIIPGLKFWKVLPFMSSRINFFEVYPDEG